MLLSTAVRLTAARLVDTLTVEIYARRRHMNPDAYTRSKMLNVDQRPAQGDAFAEIY